MVSVNGVLTRIENKKYAPFSKPGSSINAEFAYTYGAKNYVGKNMTFCSSISSGSMIDPFYEMYDELLPKVGASVTIWVDPSNPENSVLYKYIPKSAMLLVFASLFFGFFGLRKLDEFLTGFIRSDGAKSADKVKKSVHE